MHSLQEIYQRLISENYSSGTHFTLSATLVQVSDFYFPLKGISLIHLKATNKGNKDSNWSELVTRSDSATTRYKQLISIPFMWVKRLLLTSNVFLMTWRGELGIWNLLILLWSCRKIYGKWNTFATISVIFTLAVEPCSQWLISLTAGCKYLRAVRNLIVLSSEIEPERLCQATARPHVSYFFTALIVDEVTSKYQSYNILYHLFCTHIDLLSCVTTIE